MLHPSIFNRFSVTGSRGAAVSVSLPLDQSATRYIQIIIIYMTLG